MRKKLFLGAALVLAVSLVCFGLLGFDIQNEDEVDPAIAQAQAKTAQFVDMVYRAHFTGDMSELKEYLEQKDTDGIVRDLMEKNRIRLGTPRVRRMEATGTLPFGDFTDKTILLSATEGSIIYLVLPGMYTHCGSFDEQKYAATDPNQGCIITANLDGVTYETPSEWNNGVGFDKTVIRLEPNNRVSSWRLNWAQNSIMRWYQGWTIYSFLKLNLDPVSRWGPWRWYCSKTVWRVFKKAGLNVENAQYYNENTEIVTNIMDNSVLFQLYKGLLIKLGIDPGVAQAMAYNKLINALDECITPDEIRFSGNLLLKGTWGGSEPY